MLSSCCWGASVVKRDLQSSPQFEYNGLFPPSLHLPKASGAVVLNVFEQATTAPDKAYYYWLFSHRSLLSAAKAEVAELPSQLVTFQGLFKDARSGLELAKKVDSMVLNAEINTKIEKHHEQAKPQETGNSDDDADSLDIWSDEYGDKLKKFGELSKPLRLRFLPGEELKILLYELAYFLNLFSFETTFEVLQKHKQRDDYTKILVNTLGDSLLDGGQQLGQFYAQFETAFETIGYSPKDLKMFQGAAGSAMAGAFRDITGGLVAKSGNVTEQGRFARRMWRAACTIHLTATLQQVSGQERVWEETIAPMLYQAIDVGSTEAFDSGYGVYERGKYVTGHAMLVEVQRTTDSSYHVRQFNSGSGIGAIT